MPTLFNLAERRALVTGAGRGIGRAISLALAGQGASIALVARNENELEGVAEEVNALGVKSAIKSADITDDAQVEELPAWATEALGGNIDILVNNAGIYIPNRFLDYKMDEWKRMMEVNVYGVVRVTAAFLPGMLETGWGRVINISSSAGKYGSMNQSGYNASKHAVVGLTRCLALETASSGVRVNAICPGFVSTDLLPSSGLDSVLGVDEDGVRAMMDSRTPIGRATTPEEVAALTVYLASEEADSMTGIGLTLAGGLVLV